MTLETSARAELARIHANETMAAVFDEVDFIIAPPTRTWPIQPRCR